MDSAQFDTDLVLARAIVEERATAAGWRWSGTPAATIARYQGLAEYADRAIKRELSLENSSALLAPIAGDRATVTDAMLAMVQQTRRASTRAELRQRLGTPDAPTPEATDRSAQAALLVLTNLKPPSKAFWFKADAAHRVFISAAGLAENVASRPAHVTEQVAELWPIAAITGTLAVYSQLPTPLQEFRLPADRTVQLRGVLYAAGHHLAKALTQAEPPIPPTEKEAAHQDFVAEVFREEGPVFLMTGLGTVVPDPKTHINQPQRWINAVKEAPGFKRL